MNNSRKIAILLSGRGSNFLAIHDAIQRRDLDAGICCVLSNIETAVGLIRARELGLTTLCVPSRGVSRAEYDQLLLSALKPYQPQLVCLAGFMRILGSNFLKQYQGRVLNIHPSLLPAFPGLNAQRQALEHKAQIAGCTVHVVDEGVDSGPILMQGTVKVQDDDTEDSLSARILQQEHSIYWRAIALALDRNSVNAPR
jgi:phosphoribosylglycinamide formyltransferase-1